MSRLVSYWNFNLVFAMFTDCYTEPVYAYTIFPIDAVILTDFGS